MPASEGLHRARSASSSAAGTGPEQNDAARPAQGQRSAAKKKVQVGLEVGSATNVKIGLWPSKSKPFSKKSCQA